MNIRRLVITAILVGGFFILGRADELKALADIPPEAAIQAQIRRTITAGSEQIFQQELEKLRLMDAKSCTRLVPQLILYSQTATNMLDGMTCRMIMGRLGLSTPQILGALLPYLDSQDQKVRHELRNQLMDLDKSASGAPPDFSLYETIIDGSRTNPPLALIRYMYEQSPSRALMSMSRVFGNKDVETVVAAQLRQDPKSALQSFADRPEWWAHLYVVEMMKKQPQLRDTAILKKLEKDDNPLVKEKVAEITSANETP
jgi:hypothetical protein